MDEILLETEESMEKTINNLKDRLTNIRAGRANASMLDPVKVMYYGAETPLNQIYRQYKEKTLHLPIVMVLIHALKIIQLDTNIMKKIQAIKWFRQRW